MKKLLILSVFLLAGCVTTETTGDIQHRCFSDYREFEAQIECIHTGVTNHPRYGVDPLAQHYMNTVINNAEQVRDKKITTATAQKNIYNEHEQLLAAQQKEYNLQLQAIQNTNNHYSAPIKAYELKPYEIKPVGRTYQQPAPPQITLTQPTPLPHTQNNTITCNQNVAGGFSCSNGQIIQPNMGGGYSDNLGNRCVPTIGGSFRCN